MPVGGDNDGANNPLGYEDEAGDELSTEEAEEVDEMTFKAETMLRETISSVHKATASQSAAVRTAVKGWTSSS